MAKRLYQIMLGAVIGIVCLAMIPPDTVQAACPGDLSCRAYSIAYLTDASNYTAVHGRITNGIPTINDGGFSAEVLWIGDLLNVKNLVEIGWRRESGQNPKLYWGYWDNSGGWHGPFWLSTDNTAPHYFKIEHKTSDNKWHVYIDNVEKNSVTLGGSSGIIEAGGEVTDWSGSHNAMGISTFDTLTYMRNHTGYYSWNGWSAARTDYSYWFTGLSNNSFQNGGYNP